MTKSESYRTETMVGIFVLLGFAIISILVFAIAGKQKLFEPRFRITALFSTVAGLKVGSPVRLAGLEVGSVEALDFTPSGKVLAVISIQTQYQEQIRRDSVATISSVGVLGDKSVEITIGSQKEKMLTDQSRIETKDPFDVAGFVDQVAPMTAKVDDILTYLSKITGEFTMEELRIADVMEHANQILEKVDQGKGSVGLAVNNSELYREMVALARSGKDAAHDLKETLNKIEMATSDLPDVMTATRTAMEDLSAISQALRKSTERFPKIASDVSDATENLRIASEDFPGIAGSFRKSAKGAEEVIESAKKSWFIRKNLPERSTMEEQILFEGITHPHEEAGP